jgi:hypothetical protein
MTTPPTSPPNWAAWTIAVCLLAAAGEVAILLSTTKLPEPLATGLAFVAFLVGPPVFLAVMAWRRRANLVRSRSLFLFAAFVAVAGLAAYGLAAYQLRSDDPATRRNPLLNPALVPLAQWLVVLAGWVRVNAIEKQEKRRRG